MHESEECEYGEGCGCVCYSAAVGYTKVIWSLKAQDLHVFIINHWYILLVKFVDFDSSEEVGSLFEVELQKPRNLSGHESEECEHGEGGVCMLL